MRPLKLVMTGFGPYKDETAIDMESLGSGGLYLITGETGSGKTYIFDAITYALYGEMSGSGRDSRTVRSQYCTGSDISEVTLDFEYRGRRYSVTRSPEYYRPRKNGEGYTKQAADACLTKPDGSVTAGSSKVSSEIREILGIDRDQFCNIVMIAQGEFRKVLNAGTDERQKLFRRIFDTLPYSRLTDELRELSRAAQAAYDDKIRGIQLNLSTVSCSFDDELAVRLDELKERMPADSGAQDIVAFLAEMTESARSRSGELRAAVSEIEEEISSLNNKIALAQDHKKNVISLEKAVNDVPLLEKAVRDADAAYTEACACRSLTDGLINESAFIESNLESYDRLDSMSNEISVLEAKEAEKDDAAASLKEEAGRFEASLAECEREYEELRYCGEQLIRVNGSIEKSGVRISTLESLISDIDKTDGCRMILSGLQDELEPLIAAADALEAKHSRMLSAFMREQAGILASGLIEGQPCPVCGSLHHPAPADTGIEAPSAEELEKAEQSAREARDTASQKLEEVMRAKADLDAISERAGAAALRETGTADPAAAGAAARDEIKRINEEMISLKSEAARLETGAARAEELKAGIPEIRLSLQGAASKVHDAEKELAAVRASADALRQRREELRAGLAFESKADARDRIASIAAEVKSINDRIERCRQDAGQAASNKQINDARIEELRNVVSGYTPVDGEKAAEDRERAEERKAELSGQDISVNSELRAAEHALSAIRKSADDIERIRREHQTVDPLYRTAAGSLTGKERISLESYVQAFYFERIIRRANIRLRMMSDGRYEFVRSGGAADKRHQSGLDLNVLDNYSGTERPVNTLSGGETFMASLSLALGLSDEVQASAGGIKLDTMFVDEGFGSLDSETLEKAVKTLTGLSDEDRLVGIISHVDALRTRIDRQIIVTKGRDTGSTARVL